ncbi:MAG TPA: type I 3-dehydroquinate dehydratase [Rhabdochlamydiaceae bacterium]|nr:type I 3-dehydroquinate dehydratase [Rhabdochlamydiaceae bacterium]
MTLLCAPARKLTPSPKVDLIEVDKVLYDHHGGPILRDVDWEQTETGDIVSYHNFQETPDLHAVLEKMRLKHPKARYYKLATMAHSILDTFKMIELQKQGIIGVCMGALGALTRICAPIFGAPITYAPLCEEDKNAPGQLLADELDVIYHFRRLNRQTKIYGLIGDPIHRSPGHLFHNDFFRAHNLNAVYVKMVVRLHELADFLKAARSLPFGGFSVTAPLKEAVMPYLDEIDPEARAIGAVNTIVFRWGRLIGYNTDGSAAIDVLGSVKNKHLVVLGAGGAARALVYTALQRKAHVWIVNRTPEKAEALAQEFGCDWSSTVPAYDILINTTSVSRPIEPRFILPKSEVMDIALSETEFLREAQRKKCRNKNGLPMYFQQALKQQALWAY